MGNFFNALISGIVSLILSFIISLEILKIQFANAGFAGLVAIFLLPGYVLIGMLILNVLIYPLMRKLNPPKDPTPESKFVEKIILACLLVILACLIIKLHLG